MDARSTDERTSAPGHRLPVWLVAAVLALLGGVCHAQPLVEAPPTPEDLYGCVVVESAESGAGLPVFNETGRSITIPAGEHVAAVRLTRGLLVVEGTVEGDVAATESLVIIESGGAVRGSIIASQGNVVVRDGAVVGGDVRVGQGNASVQAGARVEGKVEVAQGAREVQPGARVGPQPAASKAGDPLGGLICLAFILWLLGTLVGGALCYSMAHLATLRLEAVSDALRAHRGQIVSWSCCLLGLLIACTLIPCIGWLALLPLVLVLIAAAALGWVGLLRRMGAAVSRASADPAAQLRRGFLLWALLSLVGVVPCLLPLWLLAKWTLLLYGASAALITDWGRDPDAGGCWPIRRADPS